LKASAKIDPIVTASTGFVGIRLPNHDLARALIEQSGCPIAAPSANKFGHVSPTMASHVENDFKENNVMILDGGKCGFGIESTVLKLEEVEGKTKIMLLRRGGVSEERIIGMAEAAGVDYEYKTISKKHYTDEGDN